jgi:pimeloyl-ACP methyl ester carboxylesterase
MITDSLNIKRALKWSVESDRGTVALAMFEIMTTDLRDELINVKVPILVLGSWYGYKDYGVTKENVYTNLQNQFIKADDCTIEVAEKAKHFIMWDEPGWFINEVKLFLDDRQ